MQITVSLDVFKELTARLSYEGHSYDDVLRELLGMDSPTEIESQSPLVDALEGFSVGLAKSTDPQSFHSRGLRLPHGTALRARYKGREHSARIENGEWIADDGSVQSSPSSAAGAITGNSVNGLRFWEARRPGETSWRRLENLSRR